MEAEGRGRGGGGGGVVKGRFVVFGGMRKESDGEETADENEGVE